MKIILTLFVLLMSVTMISQENEITTKLYETYEKYKEPTLKKRRIKHKDLQPLIVKLKSDPKYTVQKVGESIEGRELSLISVGTGKINVFLWSQMHGDEPTATQAIFDIINFINSKDFVEEKEAILKNATLHFLPMLNPDGAEVYTRRNRLGVDINRDALRLQSPESRTLKRVRDSLQADFGFNLHDQSTYYNAERTEKPATISYLAPAYNYEKEINTVRADAMRVIVYMNKIIQKYAKGQVGRYNDDFEPRAFGDNIQKWGTSTILIESGGYINDTEKQEIRKLNYVSILSAIYTIANGEYKKIAIEEYEKIPQNDRKLFDLKIKGVTYKLLGNDYTIDIGINQREVDNKSHTEFYNIGYVKDLGDLSTYYGYQTIEATGYTLVQGKIYPNILKTEKSLKKLDIYKLLQLGYTYVKIKQLPNRKETNLPINIVRTRFKVPTLDVKEGINPTFLLQKNGEITHAVINGYLIDLKTEENKNNFKNGLIIRK